MTERDDRLTDEGEEALDRGRSGGNGKRPTARARASHKADSEVDDRDYVERDEDEDIQLSDDERFAMFVDSLNQSVLPDLPPMPGYHVCWLTTTNPRDPVARRIRMGYQLVRAEDLGNDWMGLSLKTGEYPGVLGINEMVAARIPIRLYNRYMQELHHNLPLQDEMKLRAAMDSAKGALEARGSTIMETESMPDLVQRAPAPTFAP